MILSKLPVIVYYLFSLFFLSMNNSLDLLWINKYMNMLYTYIAQGPHWSLVLDFCNCSNAVFTTLWKKYQKKVLMWICNSLALHGWKYQNICTCRSRTTWVLSNIKYPKTRCNTHDNSKLVQYMLDKCRAILHWWHHFVHELRHQVSTL